ncbi:MAG: Asp-tRNA(Asn)/Glu-tRNA(Gln) amidotransferase subunit GatA [Erysipelotrichaceae bacterium]|jgi:aspartyl-tRNA(Asn)/glutamyl-tRNA(Gln) amidotransferase subunit A|nr:Asp-tRNA(Asn)/Glu-tRNA(Gln) amidotransferase subunit GatA [Erysipelotrichaceae bacterium]
MKLNGKTIVELHGMLVRKEITPLDLVQEAIKSAKANHNNAFELIVEKEAIKIAKQLTEPEVDNYLWGIPFVMKDNISTKGIVTTASSNILNVYVPVFDATVYRLLKRRKAILIGKTTMDELAMGGYGTTGHKGVQTNPYDSSRVAGGSSSGSAIAVAARIVPFALGSDTGDSVRKPAFYNGLVGYKGTYGAISRFGLFAFSCSLDHVGFFTRSVLDAAILFNLLAQKDEKDATSMKVKKVSLDKDIKTPTFMILDDLISLITDEDILKQYFASIKKLEALGVKVIHRSFGIDLLSAIYPVYMVLSCADATSNCAALDGIRYGAKYSGNTYEEIIFAARNQGFSSSTKQRFVFGSFCLMEENQEELYLKAQKARRLISDRLNHLLNECDVLYLPSASVAPKLETIKQPQTNEALIVENYLALANFNGSPSLSLPLGAKKGLPFGVNLIGRTFADEVVFKCALLVEKSNAFKMNPPGEPHE